MSRTLDEASPLAYEALNSFEEIISRRPIWKPDDVFVWLRNYIYKVGDDHVALHNAESLLLYRQASGEFDPSTPNTYWRGRGLVTSDPSPYLSSDGPKEAFVLGRRVSKGDPRKATVVPAVVIASSDILNGPLNSGYGFSKSYTYEDVTTDENKLTKLATWLRWINEKSMQFALQTLE